MAKLGFQLSSVTPYLETEEQLRETFKHLHEQGWDTVQLQGVPNSIDDSVIAEALRENHLTCIATQEDYPFGFGDDPQRGIDRAVAVGAKYLAVALIPFDTDTVEKLEAFALKMREINEMAKRAGITLCFHPIGMDYRLMDGVPVYERLMNLLPEDVQLTFCVSACFDKVPYEEVLEKFGSRMDLVHFKDSIILPDGTEQLMPLGEGAHDFAPIYAACEAAGAKYIFAEQERWNRDAFDCTAASFAYLQQLGLR